MKEIDVNFFKSLEDDLYKLLNNKHLNLPKDQTGRIEEYLSVGEYGLALEEICSIIQPNILIVPLESRQLIIDLAERMEILDDEEETWIQEWKLEK